jgi:hypothetical protein
MKEYTYQKMSHYWIQIVFPSLLAGCVGVYGFVKLIQLWQPAYLLLCMVCVYTFWNVFISLSNPSGISFDGKGVTFYTFSRKHTYSIDQLHAMHMHPIAGNTKVYITLDNGGIRAGRYWVRISEFDHKNELLDQLYELYAMVEPDALAVRAYRQGIERINKKSI